ncbi:DUF6216 family protein [Luteibacter sp. ME-Dv--P-043b]|uniref:DUF6216 family protein n=1 Tax=Luteibacter sp. ME-Dv--P-043b TaxID=3040291 RepID=UPI00255575C7|nr:DUF6216 family protein [Luteibacter sp. ME-Dv--P-043b]
MDFTQTMLQWASQIPTGLVALFQFIGLCVLLVLFYRRAGSGHVFWGRVWTLIHGRRLLRDPVIDRWIMQRSALMQFRVQAGVRARTHGEAIRLIEWANTHDEEMGDIRRCGNYFDRALPGLKPTLSRWQVMILGAISLLLFLGVFIAVLLALSPRAIVSVKGGDGRVLLLSTEDIRPMFSTAKFTAHDCQVGAPGKLAARVRMPVEDLRTACGWLDEPKLDAKINQTLEEQWNGGHSLALMGLIYLSFPLSWLLTATAAREMQRRLAVRSEKMTKTEDAGADPTPGVAMQPAAEAAAD